MSATNFERHAAICKALSWQARIDVLRNLKGRQLTSAQLATKLDTDHEIVHKQLKHLEAAGLCKIESEGKRRCDHVWSARNAALHELLDQASAKALEIDQYDSREIFSILAHPKVIEFLGETGSGPVNSERAREIFGSDNVINNLKVMNIIEKRKGRQGAKKITYLYRGNALGKVIEKLSALVASLDAKNPKS